MTTTLTARLRELMAEATQGEWLFLQKVGYIFCDKESVQVGVIGNFRDKELLPFNGDRWRADGNLIVELVNNAPTIIRLLESVDGAEKDRAARDQLCALTLYGWAVEKRSLYDEEGVEGWAWIDHNGAEYVEIGDWDEPPPWPDSAAAALATLRAAREGAR